MSEPVWRANGWGFLFCGVPEYGSAEGADGAMIIHDMVALLIGVTIGVTAAGDSPQVIIIPVVLAIAFIVARVIEERYK